MYSTVGFFFSNSPHTFPICSSACKILSNSLHTIPQVSSLPETFSSIYHTLSRCVWLLRFSFFRPTTFFYILVCEILRNSSHTLPLMLDCLLDSLQPSAHCFLSAKFDLLDLNNSPHTFRYVSDCRGDFQFCNNSQNTFPNIVSDCSGDPHSHSPRPLPW